MAYGQTGSGKTHTMMGGLTNDDGTEISPEFAEINIEINRQ